VGVAPKCKVIPVKALDKKGRGDLRKVAEAIRWSVDQGVDFITMSLGSPRPVDVIYKAIRYAVEKKWLYSVRPVTPETPDKFSIPLRTKKPSGSVR
jgi:subtilisin family serine protease